MRFSDGDELCCSAACTQWWLVTMSPSGDTKDAEQPPSDTMAESVSLVGSASCAGSICSPSSLSLVACAIIWLGIHIPPWFSKAGLGAGGGADAVGAGGDGGIAVVGGATGGAGASPPQASKSDVSGSRARARRLMVCARSTTGCVGRKSDY